MTIVSELRKQTSTTRLCEAMNVPRASVYRLINPPMKSAPKARPTHHRALRVEERQVVLDTLHSERFIDSSPAEAYATLLDEGQYLCSSRTMYRVLAAQQENCERRRGHNPGHYQKPQLLATAPNQVWSWDITKLLGPEKWTYFYLYVLLDIFSRYVVGWMVAERESGQYGKALIEESMAKQNIQGGLTIHSDRGSPMKSKPVAFLLADLGVVKSLSRPHVSNDNPFSEAQFKTMKYGAEFPQRFGSLQDSRGFCRPWFDWYNGEHKHSGIGYYTPEDVHYDRATTLYQQRNDILRAAYGSHPERFVRKMPEATKVPTAVWINPPTDKSEFSGKTHSQPNPLRSGLVKGEPEANRASDPQGPLQGRGEEVPAKGECEQIYNAL